MIIAQSNEQAFDPLNVLLSTPSSSSLDRPRHLPSFLILCQYSLNLELRFRAATPVVHNDKIYKQAGIIDPRQAAKLDLSAASLLRKKIFINTCREYHGRLIYIQTHENHDSNDERLDLFDQNGCVVDLSSDPLGWDDDFDNDNSNPTNIIVSRINNLEKIGKAIQQASISIQERSKDNNANMKVSSQPIPIVFDSLQPLILVNGLSATVALLHHLRTIHHSKYPEFGSVTPSPFVYSPLIAPILTHFLSPQQHRRLEDISNAIVHVHDGLCHIIKTSYRGTGKITSEQYHIKIGYQKIFDKSCGKSISVPEVFLEYGSEQNKNNNEKKESQEESEKAKGIKLINSSNKVLNPNSSTTTRQRIQIQLEEEKQKVEPNTSSNNSVLSQGPRIFLEDDDPEFDDLDEEDPDDDLDL